MLGSALPASATIHTTTSSATPTSPTRPSRLRGLSYLRSYTHNHLHSTSSRGDSPQLTRATSTPTEDSPRVLTSPRREEADTERNGQTSHIQSGENGWLPSVQGRSGLSRDSLNPTSSSEFAHSEPSNSAGMTRNRAASALGPTPTPASSTAQMPRRSSQGVGVSNAEQLPETSAHATAPTETSPSLRFIPYVETRSSRPSLQFVAVSRTLKQSNSIIRVGRYSERDNAVPTDGQSVRPVGFKSKVVSRRHCEFWCTSGQWYVKDVKSSSGTFLNHVRLSPPGFESRPFPVHDGDVVQLGIDFKGGEEVIFRCVKIRIECNRGWQKSLNSFNTSAHKKLLKNAGVKTKSRDSDAASTNSSECSICLNPVAPCQALFVAPCSHVWHYKCVRNLIHGPNYPNFSCPNCRFMADLDADVEQPEGDYEESIPEELREGFGENEPAGGVMSEEDEGGDERNHSDEPSPIREEHTSDDEDLSAMLEATSFNPRRSGGNDETLTSRQASSRPLAIRSRTEPVRATATDPVTARSATPTSNTQFALAVDVMGLNEGMPMTPRNDAGPFVFDGAPGRRGLAEQVVAEEDEDGARR